MQFCKLRFGTLSNIFEADIMNDYIYDKLLLHAHDGGVFAVLGGPNCRTWSLGGIGQFQIAQTWGQCCQVLLPGKLSINFTMAAIIS